MYHSLKLTIYIITVIIHVYTTQVTSAFSVCWLANLLFAFILMNNCWLHWSCKHKDFTKLLFSLGESVKLLIPSFCCCFFFSEALTTLGEEIIPDSPPAGASKEYRKSLALGLFYKVLKSISLKLFSSQHFSSTFQIVFKVIFWHHELHILFNDSTLSVNLFQGCLWSTYLLFFMVTCWINLQHICIGTKVIVIFLFFIVLFDSFGWQSISQG